MGFYIRYRSDAVERPYRTGKINWLIELLRSVLLADRVRDVEENFPLSSSEHHQELAPP